MIISIEKGFKNFYVLVDLDVSFYLNDYEPDEIEIEGVESIKVWLDGDPVVVTDDLRKEIEEDAINHFLANDPWGRLDRWDYAKLLNDCN